MNTTSLGKEGERKACAYLESRGYEIIRLNFCATGGEIDIICKKGSHLAFVEVKARRNKAFGSGWEAVDYFKQQRIIRTARAFLTGYDSFEDISFDVCEVYSNPPGINYIENAFEA